MVVKASIRLLQALYDYTLVGLAQGWTTGNRKYSGDFFIIIQRSW
jgi:hypothetical protein